MGYYTVNTKNPTLKHHNGEVITITKRTDFTPFAGCFLVMGTDGLSFELWAHEMKWVESNHRLQEVKLCKD